MVTNSTFRDFYERLDKTDKNKERQLREKVHGFAWSVVASANIDGLLGGNDYANFALANLLASDCTVENDKLTSACTLWCTAVKNAIISDIRKRIAKTKNPDGTIAKDAFGNEQTFERFQIVDDYSTVDDARVDALNDPRPALEAKHDFHKAWLAVADVLSKSNQLSPKEQARLAEIVKNNDFDWFIIKKDAPVSLDIHQLQAAFDVSEATARRFAAVLPKIREVLGTESLDLFLEEIGSSEQTKRDAAESTHIIKADAP